MCLQVEFVHYVEDDVIDSSFQLVESGVGIIILAKSYILCFYND